MKRQALIPSDRRGTNVGSARVGIPHRPLLLALPTHPLLPAIPTTDLNADGRRVLVGDGVGDLEGERVEHSLLQNLPTRAITPSTGRTCTHPAVMGSATPPPRCIDDVFPSRLDARTWRETVVPQLAIRCGRQTGDGLQVDGISLQIGAVILQIEGVSLVDTPHRYPPSLHHV